MKIRPTEEIKNPPPEYGLTSKLFTLSEGKGNMDESEEAVADENDGGSEEAETDINEGEEQVLIENQSDDANDFAESYYVDDSDENNEKLFIEDVDMESDWFRQEFESRVSQGVHNKFIDLEYGDDDKVNREGDLGSNNESNDENDEQNFPAFNLADLYDPTFKIGMLFSTKKELRQAIHSHAIKTKRSINITKNDKERVHAKCANKDCGWKLHALKLNDECTFQIRRYVSDHTCAASYRVKNVKSSWLATKYVKKFRSDPKRNIEGFRVDAIEDIKCHVSHWQAYKAKKKAIIQVEGSADDQYALLWDFADEVKRTNPGSTIIIGIDDSSGENRFDRLYLCLHALKAGFLAGCRPFVGVDGCHLKGPHGGVLLSAVGVDPNNNNFPIAIAIVSTESRDTWEWFLCLLKLDLNIDRDEIWTFMSDKQKGLIQAFMQVFPNADHRFCLRHLYSNFKNVGFRGEAFKMALWKCAKATTINEFGRMMKEMREIDERAAYWFNDKPPRHWSLSHFTDSPKCDMLLNNGCESFNSCILEARDKPILTMLEWMVEYLMKRMQINRDRAKSHWKGSFCPKIQKILNKNLDHVADCIPIKSDDFHYQLSCHDGTKYCVDLKKWTCGCRKWDLCGIPCKHALSAIDAQNYDYHNYTDKCYRLDTYKLVYAPSIIPLNGRNEWNHIDMIPMLPPNLGRPAGRPKKARKRERDEVKHRGKIKVISSEHRMKRQQKSVRCSQCGVIGHNKITCTESPIQPDEVVASHEQPLSQLTQELGSQRSTKVRRKVTFHVGDEKNALARPHIKSRGLASKQNKSITFSGASSGANGTHEMSPSISDRPMTRSLKAVPPSMFDQYQQCQSKMPMERAPAPFVGSCFIQSIERCITQSCITSKPIIIEGGKKFVKLANLSSTSEVNKETGKTKDIGKGKKHGE